MRPLDTRRPFTMSRDKKQLRSCVMRCVKIPEHHTAHVGTIGVNCFHPVLASAEEAKKDNGGIDVDDEIAKELLDNAIIK